MTSVVINHDHTKLPPASSGVIPVQIYDRKGLSRGDISVIGNPIIEPIKRLGVQLMPITMDFLTIALAVTAADTFVKRDQAADGWTREINIQVPLCNPKPWLSIQHKLEKALHFLSGDLWSFELSGGGFEPPSPHLHRDGFHLLKLREIDCVCLFSGGLDSAIGAIDLIGNGRKPLLVSHGYTGDKSKQDAVAARIKGLYKRFSLNADPQPAKKGMADITMRTRSITFLSFAVVGLDALVQINQLKKTELIMPENGFISLNVPLTVRRIGSLSTRTTHPHFISFIQEIFKAVGISAQIINPYQFQTKGEMIDSCIDKELLAQTIPDTISCSNWKRKGQQCGRCVPCLIRRAAISKAGMKEPRHYQYQDLRTVFANEKAKDDIFALISAIKQAPKRSIRSWIADSGPLPPEYISNYQGMFERGLNEVAEFLKGND